MELSPTEIAGLTAAVVAGAKAIEVGFGKLVQAMNKHGDAAAEDKTEKEKSIINNRLTALEQQNIRFDEGFKRVEERIETLKDTIREVEDRNTKAVESMNRAHDSFKELATKLAGGAP